MASERLYNLPEDAVWFITGCSSGIGLSLAKIIASHPTHRLVATARNSSKLAAALPSDLTVTERVCTLDLDVTSDASIAAAVDAAVARFGRIDVLVNNAGYGLMGDTESVLDAPADRAKARRVVETDFWGTVTLSLHAIRVFRDVNPLSDSGGASGQRGGVVLNVTSLGGFAAFPGSAFYHAAKFAVEGFTESVGKEVRPEWNIHFCIVEPGATRTEFVSRGMDWLSAHPAYAAGDSPSRVLERRVVDLEMQHRTWTPAEKVAGAMYRVVARAGTDPIPVRLPLTEGAWLVVKDKVAAVDKELEEVREMSLSVEMDDVNQVGAFLRENFS